RDPDPAQERAGQAVYAHVRDGRRQVALPGRSAACHLAQGHRAQDRRPRPAFHPGRHIAGDHVRTADPFGRAGGGDHRRRGRRQGPTAVHLLRQGGTEVRVLSRLFRKITIARPSCRAIAFPGYAIVSMPAQNSMPALVSTSTLPAEVSLPSAPALKTESPALTVDSTPSCCTCMGVVLAAISTRPDGSIAKVRS